ncbi:response regulator [Flavobacterium sp. AG291]|uniref:response regulator n=1 Tax=Flavobacterium sp. AG291 TaxID=2184000 RepID=UPI000E0A15A4|nr:response regulator [Flavobacterium sp. AG291]RDI13385.1 two-component system response regulator (stage 0 sporulation protein F) [Flavobacterium sp. AG291]
MKSDFTIFYTDDDEDDLEFFTEIVDSININYTVVTQKNGQQLLDALNNPPPTPYMIFLDINMPGLNGLETLKKIRESNNDIPVIMLSTSGDSEIIEQSRELGANFYVAKSGMFSELKKSIEDTIKINWSNFKPSPNNFVYSFF